MKKNQSICRTYEKAALLLECPTCPNTVLIANSDNRALSAEFKKAKRGECYKKVECSHIACSLDDAPYIWANGLNYVHLGGFQVLSDFLKVR